MGKRFSVLALVVILSSAVLGNIIVDDHFDDNAIGTNTTGIGTGFNTASLTGGSVTESDSSANLNNTTNGAARATIASKEGASIGSGITRFEFRGVSFAQNTGNTGTGSTGRTAVGVRGDSTAEDVENGPATGFWIQFESGDIGENNASWSGTSTLFYESSTNVKTVLATWEFDTLNWDNNNAATMNFTPVLNITLDLNPTGYSLTFEGDTISNVTGSLSSSYALAGITNELTSGYAFAFNQGEAPGLNMSIDQIIITENATPPVFASLPNPEDGEKDVIRDVILSWTPGVSANTHNVFFGADFNDVNDAAVGDTLGVTVTQDLAKDVNYLDPGTLEYGTTYYWRVDEVNAPPDTDVVYKGEVWSFTTEAFAFKVPVSDIKVTAKNNKSDPNNTINESGLDLPNNPDQHSSSAGLWQSGATNGPTDLLWIRYDFAKTYKLHEMLVWNMNNKPLLTQGFKQVRIEYLPPDSNEWTILTEMEFAKGAGTNGYVYNTTVPFNDTVAKAVRLTMINNWGGKDTSGALSEIRFTYIPTRARLPHPETGTTDVSVASSVSWRAGREAVSHNVYIDTNEDAVKNGTAAAHPVSTSSYSPSLSFGRIYYWRVDEINNSMTPSVWKGDIWSFTTQEYKSIEDFEDYNDFPGSLIYETWLDGLTNSALGGSVVGHEIAPFAEKTIVPPGSRQSLPLYYNNTAAGTNTSIAERTFDGTENMSANGADTLVLYYRGRAVTFQQASDGSIAMSGEGSDIFGTADQFRFAHKTMTGNGSITVRVDSIENANAWSKAGIMIRNSLDADDMHAAVILGANGTSEFQRRSAKGGTTTNSDVAGLGSPCWVRLTRNGDDFTAQRSKDGSNWLSFETDANLPSKVTIDMGNTVYIGLVVTSHTADVLAAATFYSVSTSNNVTGSTWTVAAIGDASQAEGGNTLDALYVSLSDSAGKSAKVYAPLLSAAGSGSWQKWEIPTSQFTGVDRTKIKKIAIGVGNTAAPLKGNGLIYIDNITLGHALEQ